MAESDGDKRVVKGNVVEGDGSGPMYDILVRLFRASARSRRGFSNVELETRLLALMHAYLR